MEINPRQLPRMPKTDKIELMFSLHSILKQFDEMKENAPMRELRNSDLPPGWILHPMRGQTARDANETIDGLTDLYKSKENHHHE